MSGSPYAARSTPTPYTPNMAPSPVDPSYLLQELKNIGNCLATTQRMCPQPATASPKDLLDGMVRLSRLPWRPVAGQTSDQWVYYDGVGKVWRLLATAPTNV